MVSLHVVFWMFVVLFALVGAMRGWARELLVTFAVIVALFTLTVFERLVPFVSTVIASTPPNYLFFFRTIIVLALVFFGYQTPHLPRLAGSPRFARERIQDTLLGFLMGAVNGFLVFGTIWYFLNEANYPFPIITPPIPGTAGGDAAARLLPLLPPHWLVSPTIYIAVAVAFLFVIVVFL